MERIPSFRDQLQNESNPSWRDNLSNELYHHGVKGMHWGVRRPRNEDGIIQGAGKGLFKKMKARRQRNKDAKQEYKAAKAKAKKDLQEWGDKANARYAKDEKYRKSGQIGTEAEKAVDRYNKAAKSAKTKYKQTVNANKIDRLKKRAKRYGTMAGMNRTMGKALTTNKHGTMTRILAAPAAGIAKINETYYTGRQNSTKRKINRLSN